jgi:serine/threonine-protein kinase HipA
MKRTVDVCVGESASEVGTLGYEESGNRRSVSFVYAPGWLASAQRFALSPDLPLVPGHQYRANKERNQSTFFGCFADVEPDGWGRMVIERDHAKQRKEPGGADLARDPLTDMDFLLWVSDTSRMGAIRFRDTDGTFLRPSGGKRETPALIALPHLLSAAKAFDEDKETARDLALLRGDGSPLGGLRPKCSIRDADGSLAIGKFPSVRDTRSVVHGEVLALHLAASAGIEAARARVVDAEGVPVAIITRFDRHEGKRLMYLSARSLLQASVSQQYSYVDMAGSIREYSGQAAKDLAELWRRMVFNIFINNIDDHLNNHGFLHVAHDQWKLAPAFDLNPFPDKARSLKTWISDQTGDTASIAEALAVAAQFGLNTATAARVLDEVRDAVRTWSSVARDLGMSSADIKRYAPAFAHPDL